MNEIYVRGTARITSFLGHIETREYKVHKYSLVLDGHVIKYKKKLFDNNIFGSENTLKLIK
jgi:hypothetical protein